MLKKGNVREGISYEQMDSKDISFKFQRDMFGYKETICLIRSIHGIMGLFLKLR
jgi:hypothetical protein